MVGRRGTVHPLLKVCLLLAVLAAKFGQSDSMRVLWSLVEVQGWVESASVDWGEL